MRTIPISQVDALFANGSYPIEFLFFYKQGFSTQRLRRALRHLAPLFWPIFGDYRQGSIVYEQYRECDFFDEETVNQELDTLEMEHSGAKKIAHYSLPELEKLFFLKVIRFKNGKMIIPKLDHLAGDGYSYFYFLSALAALPLPLRPRILTS